jgi:hypothetical protein
VKTKKPVIGIAAAMIAGAFLPAGAQADGQPLLLPGAYVGLEGG